MRNSAVFIGVALVLAGCGGGGGGSPDPVVPGPAQISAANYPLVAQESMSTALAVTDSALALNVLAGAQVSRDQLALDFARAQIPRLRAWFASAPRLVTGATTTTTVACDVGTMDITTNDVNNNNQPDAGDSFSLVAHNCGYAGASLNGSLAFTLNSVTGDLNTDVYSLAMAMTLTNMVVTDQTGSVTSNASMTASIASNGVNSSSFSISTSNYTMVSTRANVSYTRTLSNFSATQTTTPIALGSYRVAITANGTVTSTGMDGKSVEFATVTPFTSNAGQSFPTSGQPIATGASGSKIRMTALNDGTGVLVELDADGNGTYEASRTNRWVELT